MNTTTRFLNKKTARLLSAGLCLLMSAPALGDDTAARLAALEARIAELEKRLEEQASAQRDTLASQTGGTEAATPNTENAAFSDRLTAVETHLAAMEEAKASDWTEGLSLGGYGELHYNNLTGRGGAADKREIDFHRFVLTLGKSFNERIRLNSELELEHVMAGDNEKGYMALEQAYLDFDMNDRHTARAGLFLLPVGLLNTSHEPTRFYGVERNPVERDVIPTTWWEAGVGSHGWFTDSLEYAAYLHSGLKTDASKNYSVRSGRQKVAYANASDPAGTLALNWHMPGLTLGGSLQYQSDITQGLPQGPVHGLFSEGHLDWQYQRFGLRMLYAQWNLGGDGPENIGADYQYGWYIEPSYRLTSQVGLFTRYNAWDNRAGSGASPSGKRQLDFGVNWSPHKQVIVKADYQIQDNENGQNQNGINLGVGYEF